MRLRLPGRALYLLVLALFAGISPATRAGPEASTGKNPQQNVAIWDTGKTSGEPLAVEAVAAQQGWALVPAKSTPAGFQGDAVLGNGRILLVVRKQAPAAEVYALGPNGPAARLRLGLQASEGNAAGRLEHVAVVENTRTASCLELTYRTAQGAALV